MPDVSFIYIPLWMFLMVTGIPTAFLFYLDRRKILPGHCKHCDYDLRSISDGRCPECGTAAVVEGAA